MEPPRSVIKSGSCSELFVTIPDVGGDISLWQPEPATFVRPGAMNCAATKALVRVAQYKKHGAAFASIAGPSCLLPPFFVAAQFIVPET